MWDKLAICAGCSGAGTNSAPGSERLGRLSIFTGGTASYWPEIDTLAVGRVCLGRDRSGNLELYALNFVGTFSIIGVVGSNLIANFRGADEQVHR